MFERFTERARAVVKLAQDEARVLKHSYIGTEHILLGILREEEGIGAQVLNGLGLSAADASESIARIVGAGDKEITGQIPFTPRAKKDLELALREALSLGHNYIGTEHVLLGLARENGGVANRILTEHGIDGDKIRREVVRFLSGPGARRPVPVPATYTVGGLKCRNCNWKQPSGPSRLEIPQGQLVEDTACPACRCGTLSTPIGA